MCKTLKERLRFIAANENVSERIFSRSLGQSFGWLANASSNVSSNALINLFSKYPQYSWRWVLFGEGDFLKAEKTKNGESPEKISELESSVEQTKEEVAQLKKENSQMRESYIALMECNARLLKQVTDLHVESLA